jgi:organic hydroperoxide reductase OsmC/OhrA
MSMEIKAVVENTEAEHHVEVETGGRSQRLSIPPKTAGRGSAVNGGELLCAALATCYCNDLHREAAKRKITIHEVRVEVVATFGAEGEPASEITYVARVRADAPEAVIQELVRATDAVAEVQNTLRAGCRVRLASSG